MDNHRLILKSNINEGYIKAEDEQGNYSLWDGDGLRFFKAGFPSIPFWYNKKIAFGIAEHNEYVDLSAGKWDRPPSVHLAASNFPVYLSSKSGQGQVLDIGIDGPVTTNGFRVRARLNALGSQFNFNQERRVVAESGTKTFLLFYSNNDYNCNRIIINYTMVHYEKSSYYSGGKLITPNSNAVTRLELRKRNPDGSWSHISNLEGALSGSHEWNITDTADTGILTPGSYGVRLLAANNQTAGRSGDTWAKTQSNNITFFFAGETEAATGEVVWIAVENSQ
ncbi:MAG: hypothetical protein MI740_10540 [Halanaerobiales bacterium]|nr:hypothetical protein [Halanaerobiales bacterium]